MRERNALRKLSVLGQALECTFAWRCAFCQAFRDQDFEAAAALYSRALELADAETSKTLLSNRSAAYAASGNFRAALDDATRCEELAPAWPKSLFRRGVALRGLKRFDMAISAFAQGQEQETWLPNAMAVFL